MEVINAQRPGVVDADTGAEHTPPAALREHARAWVGLVGAGGAWAVQLQASYTIAAYAPKAAGAWALHVVTALCLGAAAWAGWVAWMQWVRPTGAEGTQGRERGRFLGLVGVLTSAMFFLLIVVQGVASFVFAPGEV